mgnify:CR=1 FL=1
MAVKPLRCPHCGGVIETFDETMKKGFCPFCDKLIEDVQERQAEMGQMSVIVNKEQDALTNKVKKSGIIRFIIAIVALIVIIVYFIHQSTLGGNGEVIGRSNLPFLLCIALLVGTVIGLIIDLIHRKKKRINLIFSIYAIIISVITFASMFPLDIWSSNEYNRRRAAYWEQYESDSSLEGDTTVSENELKPEEEAAIKVVETLKSVLKNPDSMQIHSMTYCTGEYSKDMIDYALENFNLIYQNIEDYLDFDYLFKIDFSAENGFGGTNRETYYISYKSGYVSTYQLGEEEQFSFKNMAEYYLNFLFDIDVDKLGL